jgi:hypothetical protein
MDGIKGYSWSLLAHSIPQAPSVRNTTSIGKSDSISDSIVMIRIY